MGEPIERCGATRCAHGGPPDLKHCAACHAYAVLTARRPTARRPLWQRLYHWLDWREVGRALKNGRAKWPQ